MHAYSLKYCPSSRDCRGVAGSELSRAFFCARLRLPCAAAFDRFNEGDRPRVDCFSDGGAGMMPMKTCLAFIMSSSVMFGGGVGSGAEDGGGAGVADASDAPSASSAFFAAFVSARSRSSSSSKIGGGMSADPGSADVAPISKRPSKIGEPVLSWWACASARR